MFLPGYDQAFPFLLLNESIKIEDDSDMSDEEDHVAPGPSSSTVRKKTIQRNKILSTF